MLLQGTLVNVAAVIVGSGVGLLVGDRMSEKFKKADWASIVRFGQELLTEKTKDLPGTVRGPEGEFAVDARERIAAFVDLIVKALKG